MNAQLIKLVSVVHLIIPAGVLSAQGDRLQKPQPMANGEFRVSQTSQKQQRTWKVKHVVEHDSSVMVLAMSPDGKEVSAGGIVSPNISVWDVETGRLIRSLRGLKGGVRALGYSPDGKLFATGRTMVGPNDTCVYVFRAGTDTILQQLRPPKITTRFAPKGVSSVESLQYSPDSKYWRSDSTAGRLVSTMLRLLN